ncbi:penicillin-binding protein 2 [Propionispira arboris]|uniref:Penicillin-binding protein 2 n=1 Tax=Propionispira arboris TaxID=84035 RepID=A0A1H6ZCH7_9FIRM|nr:penicillin-binding protein 2 [Propionispira arboris]SEJ51283.1 penicillin-binding protein 2 [Propionispira arboris]
MKDSMQVRFREAMIQKRLMIVQWIVVSIIFLLLGRVAFLQIITGQYYEGLSETNRIRTVSIEAPRGKFLDENGSLLVSNRPSFVVSAWLFPRNISADEIQRLADILHMDSLEIQEKIQQPHSLPFLPVKIKEDVDLTTITQIEAKKEEFPQIVIKTEPIRNYLYGNFAAQIFGYTGEISQNELAKNPTEYKSGDLIGKLGLEKTYDAYIRGKAGADRVEVDAGGQMVKLLHRVLPVPGNNLFLTIDASVQKAAEEAVDTQLKLLQTQHKTKAQAAAVVVMNPNTGAIIAMVSKPDFNPNLFNGGISKKAWDVIINNPFNPIENRAISGEYSPGSTFKIVTGTAALELGKVTTEEKILDTGKHWLIPKGNADGEALGWISFQEALAKSDNVYFYEMGNRVGIDNLARYAYLYGLGKPTGIDLTGEASGIVASQEYKQKIYDEPWYLAETFDAAIGQGFQLVTPIQIAMLMSQIANGGDRYKPFLVDKIVSDQGEIVKQFSPEKTGQISIQPSTLTAIRNALHDVAMSGGTASTVFQGFPIPIASKTGTVENSRGDDHGWFVAYAPFDKPEVVVAVLVEHGGYGTASAAPIVRKILEAYFKIQ